MKFFNLADGFGFIEKDKGQSFVHIVAVGRGGTRSPAKGRQVSFDIATADRTSKSAAENPPAA